MMPKTCSFYKLGLMFFFLFIAGKTRAQDKIVLSQMTASVQEFIGSLDTEKRKEACVVFADPLRLDWHYVPRMRKGITIKEMSATQKARAFEMVKTILSAGGYQKIKDIIDLENVLRVIESRSATDTYRDPENYSFLIFGVPGGKEPWGWRMEGHHIALHFTVAGEKISFTPGFFGSNPGIVLADVPQKGRQILKDEEETAFTLLQSLSPEQTRKAILTEKAPFEIFSSNKQSDQIKLTPEGLAMKDMSKAQKVVFLRLISVYLNRYHVTLKDQQMIKLQKSGLDGIHFAWMGNRKPEVKDGAGYYYRIQGPTILIELDNTQNNGNHVHTVVRDLTNDFGEDLLRLHYQKMHAGH